MDYLQQRLLSILFYLPVVFIALPFHEAAHAYAAHLLGDDTAKYNGRLTLNPLKHLDLLGVICLILGGFGWAKPVPVNYNNFKNRRVGFAITALAGPLSNLLLSGFSFLILLALKYIVPSFIVYSATTVNIYGIVYTLLIVFCTSNIMLAIFNLIPLPPLDGSRIFSLIFPDKVNSWLLRNERYISFIFLALIISGALDYPFAFISSAVENFLINI